MILMDGRTSGARNISLWTLCNPFNRLFRSEGNPPRVRSNEIFRILLDNPGLLRKVKQYCSQPLSCLSRRFFNSGVCRWSTYDIGMRKMISSPYGIKDYYEYLRLTIGCNYSILHDQRYTLGKGVHNPHGTNFFIPLFLHGLPSRHLVFRSSNGGISFMFYFDRNHGETTPESFPPVHSVVITDQERDPRTVTQVYSFHPMAQGIHREGLRLGLDLREILFPRGLGEDIAYYEFNIKEEIHMDPSTLRDPLSWSGRDILVHGFPPLTRVYPSTPLERVIPDRIDNFILDLRNLHPLTNERRRIMEIRYMTPSPELHDFLENCFR